jgi:hypothetical protein
MLQSEDPSVRFKVLVNVLGKDLNSKQVQNLQSEIAVSPRVRMLLSERNSKGQIPFRVYAKWYGAHWVLASLSDNGYPTGDKSLVPTREQVYRWLLSKDYERYMVPTKGRVLIHASIGGNAIYYLLRLGLADERTEKLVARLLETQWPDGGWNCDRKAKGETSSFTESLIPLRALALHFKLTRKQASGETAKQAAELFLQRRLYKRKRDGRVMSKHFTRLRYPCYWHYDILFGLKVMAEAGFISDKRCQDALDLLEAKQLPDGGFAAEGKYYQATRRMIKSRRSLVSWGPSGMKSMNGHVTADALYVLRAAGRLANG